MVRISLVMFTVHLTLAGSANGQFIGGTAALAWSTYSDAAIKSNGISSASAVRDQPWRRAKASSSAMTSENSITVTATASATAVADEGVSVWAGAGADGSVMGSVNVEAGSKFTLVWSPANSDGITTSSYDFTESGSYLFDDLLTLTGASGFFNLNARATSRQTNTSTLSYTETGLAVWGFSNTNSSGNGHLPAGGSDNPGKTDENYKPIDDDAAIMPTEVAGAWLTFPSLEDYGVNSPIFIESPAGSNLTSIAPVQGYQITTPGATISEFGIPASYIADTQFTVEVLDQEFAISVGEVLDFVDLVGSAVSEFTVSGIDASLLPSDPMPFQASLEFPTEGIRHIGIIPVVEYIPGDFDRSGVVDGADFLTWQRADQSIPENAAVLPDWQSHYGESVTTASLAVVPEPTTVMMLFLAAGAFFVWHDIK